MAITTPDPRPAIQKNISAQFNSNTKKTINSKLTIPNQSTHIDNTSPIRQRNWFTYANPILKFTHSRIFLPSFCLACQTTFINFQIDGVNESDVGWDTVAGAEFNEVAWNYFIS